MRSKIRDRNISLDEWSFSHSNVIREGLALRAAYRNGFHYEIPLEYILLWDCELQNHRVRNVRTTKVLRTKRVADGLAISVTLNDGRRFLIAWDTVLMACEPQYEHFGGLTHKSKQIVKKNWKKFIRTSI